MLDFITRGFDGETWTELPLVRQRKDGSLVDVEISAAALRDDRGAIVAMLSIISDVTERKRAAELLRTQELELRQREQLDAIGKLAGGIAHDFNNLLTAIHGQALLALEELGSDDPRALSLEPIVDAAKRATSLTRQLLAFGRRQVLEARVLSLNAVVESIEPLLRRLAGEGIDVTTRLGDDIRAVEADPTQLDQVLVNLVSNARDAMPRGGSIVITTSSAEVERAGQGVDHFTLLTVSDTGLGMSEGVRTRVFEPFFTTKEMGKGSGLGLSTVYGIVAQSGGFVEFDTEVGEGTTFRVYLPSVARAATEELGDAARRTGSGGGGERVLLVEDEPLVRDLVRRVLELEGYRVTAAASASRGARGGSGGRLRPAGLGRRDAGHERAGARHAPSGAKPRARRALHLGIQRDSGRRLRRAGADGRAAPEAVHPGGSRRARARRPRRGSVGPERYAPRRRASERRREERRPNQARRPTSPRGASTSVATRTAIPSQARISSARSIARSKPEGTGTTLELSGVRSSSEIVAFCASALTAVFPRVAVPSSSRRALRRACELRSLDCVEIVLQEAGVDRCKLCAELGDPLGEGLERALEILDLHVLREDRAELRQARDRLLGTGMRDPQRQRGGAGLAACHLRADDVPTELTGDLECPLRCSRDRVGVGDLERQLRGVALCPTRCRRRRGCALAWSRRKRRLGRRALGESVSGRSRPRPRAPLSSRFGRPRAAQAAIRSRARR